MDYPVSVPGVGLVGGKFVDEDAAVGQIGSLIPAAWGNAVTDEIVAVIEAAGLTPSEADNTQMLQAMRELAATAATAPDATTSTTRFSLALDGGVLIATEQ